MNANISETAFETVIETCWLANRRAALITAVVAGQIVVPQDATPRNKGEVSC
jgi:hypothetical protein